MSWQLSVTLEDGQLANLLYKVMLEKLVEKLGMPEIKMIDGKVVCAYKDLPDIEHIQKIVFGVVELERTPEAVAVSDEGQGAG